VKPQCKLKNTALPSKVFFEKGIRMLPERWKKCVDSGGEYIED
jgi:hypothetical protein